MPSNKLTNNRLAGPYRKTISEVEPFDKRWTRIFNGLQRASITIKTRAENLINFKKNYFKMT